MRTCNELVPVQELQKAKDHLKGGLVLSMETSDELASFYGGQEIITKKIATPEEVFAKIDAVTSEEVQHVAQEIFQDNRLNLSLIGPIKDETIFEKFLHFE